MEEVSETVSTQDLLLNLIEREPGIRYRELLRSTGLANGVLTYHLSALERASVVRVDRQQARITRYYPVNVPESESQVLGYIRHEPIREIVSFILSQDMCTFAEIVEHTGKAPSTVSAHLKRLKDAGILSVRYGEYQLYSLANKDLIADVLSKYRRTFADKVVDNYVEMLDEL
ncbi:winged helix-turn-helix transcriptional regulator [Nitrososphaera viennensis]|uniref:Transcriptional regulator, ArsR family n=2 Tax=Nitrososphaera viennensis TaxID=1034015 RepID=A0A060HJG5_9ARCH|nr:winged helix-turn-helix transcriptional regulator [Nitrososphaera viennensis]AIC15668.1 transcriptional regulator, ArsR family [Nitrososphaera viennensis EN76]UVS70541.1 winged helix-turn-helix transcriptional regulator [Nitrososphaera viennensis]